MNSLSFLAHPCPVHVLLFCSKDSLTRRVPFFALWLTHYNLLFIGLELTKAPLMPFKQLSRMLSHHRRQNLLHNRSNFQILRPSNLRFFIISLSYCICSSSCFPLCQRARPCISVFYLAHTRFFWVSPFLCQLHQLYYVIHILSCCLLIYSLYSFQYATFSTCFSHIVAFIYFSIRPLFLSSVFGTFQFVYLFSLPLLRPFLFLPFLFPRDFYFWVYTKSRLFI